MTTLVQEPGEVAFAKNAIPFKVLSTDGDGNLYRAIGVRAELRTTGFFAIPEDDSFDLTWTEPDGSTGTITFTAKDAYSAITEIPSDASSGYSGFTEYWILVAATIAKHPVVGPLFRVYAQHTVTGDSVFFEARDTDENWVIDLTITGLTNPSFSKHQDTDPVPDNTPNNYQVLLEVFFEDTYAAGDFARVAQLFSIPGADGYTTFDISDILDASISEAIGNLPIPAFSDNTPYLADNLRRYYIRFREDYDAITPVTWESSDIKNVMAGGISQAAWANYEFFDALSEDNAILSWYPDKKTVGPDQPEWLAWYNATLTTRQILIELRRYTSGGALSTLYKFEGNNIDVAPGEVLMIPVGYDQMAINNTAVQKYTVRVVDEAGDYENTPDYLSQLRTFYVDHNIYRSTKYLIYLSAFQLPETVRCIGQHDITLEIAATDSFTATPLGSRGEVELVIPSNYSSATPQRRQVTEQWENKLTYRTANLPRYEVDALQQMLVSGNCWEVYTDGYIALSIVDKKYRIYSTKDFLYALEFNCVPALRMRNYSNILIPLSETQEGWLTDLDEYWRTAWGLPWETP